MVTTSIEPPADLSAFGKARASVQGSPLTGEALSKMDAYWRASLYLSLGMIYLRDNPLLEEPLMAEHTKFRLLGHWGSDPGISLIYVHLNRLIKKYRVGCDRPRPSPESCWRRPCQGAFPKRADCLLQLCLRSRHRQAGDP